MSIVVLNWSLGENDPFTPFTNLLARRLEQHGHEVVVVGVDREMPKRLVDAKAGGAELALTWQGLGSDLRASSTGTSLWDQLQLPLVCMHGDHPCHMPTNHRHDSRFVAHLYGAESFAEFARLHIPGAAQAESFNMPNIFVGGL